MQNSRRSFCPRSRAVVLSSVLSLLLLNACDSEPAPLQPAPQAGPQAAPEVAPEQGPDAATQVNDLADRYYTFQIENQPEVAYFSGVEIKVHDGLSDNSPEALARAQQFEDELWAELQTVDAASLKGSVDWITYGFLREALLSSHGLRICHNPWWAVSQMNGWQLIYTQLAALQPVNTLQFRQQAMIRWHKLPAFIDQEVVNLQTGLAAGYSAPQSVVNRVIAQLDGILAIPAADSPFASPAQRDTDAKFQAAFIAVVADEILPATQRYRDFLANDYLPKAREALAVTANPDGRACYEASLRASTTLDRSAEEVFALGQATVTANRVQVIELGQAAYGLDDFTAIIERIKNDPKDRFASREELMAFVETAVDRAAGKTREWFGYVPDRLAEVKPYPDFQESTGVSDSYEAGTPDRPGVYRINLSDATNKSRGTAETTAFHEVWPGHHLQVSISQEIKGLHPITRIIWYSGMGEGWARYAETLAYEMGLYSTQTGPISRLAWPARGMVVDPGIHVFGWTREQAIEFMGEAGRMTDKELNDMVDRIAILPGQLTSYDSGGLEIRALRTLAEEQLGAGFDIREFHDQVLRNGTVPLTLLRETIETWIKTKLDMAAASDS